MSETTVRWTIDERHGDGPWVPHHPLGWGQWWWSGAAAFFVKNFKFSGLPPLNRPPLFRTHHGLYE